MNEIETIEAPEVTTTTELSMKELDAIAGARTLVQSFVAGFVSTCPDAGYRSIVKATAGCF
jgi:hypothetical protein